MTDHPTLWRKSSFSGSQSNCVEIGTGVAGLGETVLVRNSTRPDAGTLTLGRSALAAFVAGCAAGELDDLT